MPAGSVTVKIYRVRNKTYRSTTKRGKISLKPRHAFLVSYFAGGKRVQKMCARFENALAYAKSKAETLSCGELDALQLRAADARAYVNCVDLAKVTGLALEVLVKDYVEAWTALGGRASVPEAAREYAHRHQHNLPKKTVHETVEKDHGRIETRRYYQSAALDWFADRAAWEGLQSVGMVEAIRELGDQRTVERRYYLSSLPVAVATFARAVRGHWGVENKLHWVLDVQMREDQSRARAGCAAENLATLRRLALNLLKREKTKRRGIHGKQLNASWDHAYLLRLLGVPI